MVSGIPFAASAVEPPAGAKYRIPHAVRVGRIVDGGERQRESGIVARRGGLAAREIHGAVLCRSARRRRILDEHGGRQAGRRIARIDEALIAQCRMRVAEVQTEGPVLVGGVYQVAFRAVHPRIDVHVDRIVVEDLRDLQAFVIVVPDVCVDLQGLAERRVLRAQFDRIDAFGTIRRRNALQLRIRGQARIKSARFVAARKVQIDLGRVGEVELRRILQDRTAAVIDVALILKLIIARRTLKRAIRRDVGRANRHERVDQRDTILLGLVVIRPTPADRQFQQIGDDVVICFAVERLRLERHAAVSRRAIVVIGRRQRATWRRRAEGNRAS